MLIGSHLLSKYKFGYVHLEDGKSFVILFNNGNKKSIIEDTIRQNFGISKDEELKMVKSSDIKGNIDNLYVFSPPDRKEHFASTIKKV